MLKILHVVQAATSGGGTRLIFALAKNMSYSGSMQHKVVSLSPASAEGMSLAESANIPLITEPDNATLRQEFAQADIVHIHYWNSPKMSAMLRSQLPAMRLLIWFHIVGNTPPQVITRSLLEFADVALASNSYSLTLPAFKNFPAEGSNRRIGMIYGPADFDRLGGLAPVPHTTFNVGYIGTIDFVKMHPSYIKMHTAIDIPNLRVIVCGKGGLNDDVEHLLRRQAQDSGKEDLFDFRGYVEDISSIISTLDIYGYPLCEDTYASSELNLQEVMFAGLPPVVFPYGGVRDLVINGETGLVVESEREYTQAIEYLYHHREEIKRLGRNAHEYAKRFFGAQNAAAQMKSVYESMMLLPKRERQWSPQLADSSLNERTSIAPPILSRETLGAQMFVDALGSFGSAYIISMRSQDIDEILEAEQVISSHGRSVLMRATGYGSVFHYCKYYPQDRYLRLWAGLLLHQMHQDVRAMVEFAEAIRLGLTHWRVYLYLAEAAEAANNLNLAAESLQAVIHAAPHNTRAHQLAQRILKQKEDK